MFFLSALRLPIISLCRVLVAAVAAHFRDSIQSSQTQLQRGVSLHPNEQNCTNHLINSRVQLLIRTE